MKKLHTLNILLIAMAMFIGGCKKKDTAPAPVNGLVANATTIETTNGNYTDTVQFNYSYDAQARIKQTQYMIGSGGLIDTRSYTYNAGQVTVIQGMDTTVYTLNGLGQAVSDNQGGVYTYDANGYLATEVDAYGDLYSLITQSGNLIKKVNTNNGITDDYTYFTTPEYRNYGNNFMGKPNTNVLSSDLIEPSSNITYNYTYDTKGRVKIQTMSAGSDVGVTTYTYVN